MATQNSWHLPVLCQKVCSPSGTMATLELLFSWQPSQIPVTGSAQSVSGTQQRVSLKPRQELHRKVKMCARYIRFFCPSLFFFCLFFSSSEYHFVERNNVLSDSRIKRFCFVKRFVYCLFSLLFAHSNNISGEKDPAFGLSREICCCFIVFTCRFLSTTTFPLPN